MLGMTINSPQPLLQLGILESSQPPSFCAMASLAIVTVGLGLNAVVPPYVALQSPLPQSVVGRTQESFVLTHLNGSAIQHDSRPL
jgi:hypothetical protein